MGLAVGRRAARLAVELHALRAANAMLREEAAEGQAALGDGLLVTLLVLVLGVGHSKLVRSPFSRLLKGPSTWNCATSCMLMPK